LARPTIARTAPRRVTVVRIVFPSPVNVTVVRTVFPSPVHVIVVPWTARRRVAVARTVLLSWFEKEAVIIFLFHVWPIVLIIDPCSSYVQLRKNPTYEIRHSDISFVRCWLMKSISKLFIIHF
jgi:hypothetical protein